LFRHMECNLIYNNEKGQNKGAYLIYQAEKDNIFRWDGRRGHYEVYYIKFNHLQSRTGYWLRYTLLSPLEGEAIAELWGMFYDPSNPNNNFALKETYPLSETQFSRERFYLRIGPSALYHTGAKGEIKKYGSSLRWNLSFSMNRMSFRHFPIDLMYRLALPRTKVLSPHFDTRVSGRIEVNGRIYECQNEPGQQAHLWGTKNAEMWTWGHCNAFAEDPGAVFEGISARFRIGPWLSPAVNPFFIRWKGMDYSMNGFLQSVRNESRTELPRWSFNARSGDFTFSGEMSARTEDFIGVEYTDPDGEKLWCNNTKVANLVITIYKNGRKLDTLTSERAAAFEKVAREKDNRIPIRI